MGTDQGRIVMKKIVAAFVAGVVLATAGVGLASTQWKHTGTTYSCLGGPVSVFCKETNWKGVYQIALYPGAVSISYRTRLIFHCNRKFQPADNCVYYGP